MSTLSDALAGGSQFVRWDDLGVGGTVTGTIDTVDIRQARKFQSTELAFWPDGKPQMQAVVTIYTGSKLDADDDGYRAVSINLWSGQKRALAEACREAGVDEPKPGQEFTATWVSGVGKSGDPRIFTYKITGTPDGTVAGAIATPPAAAGAATPPAAAGAATPPADLAAAQAALANLTPAQRAALGITS